MSSSINHHLNLLFEKKKYAPWALIRAFAVRLNSRGGGTPHMKGVGMLVVSLRGAKFRILVSLRVFLENAIIFSREGLVHVKKM